MRLISRITAVVAAVTLGVAAAATGAAAYDFTGGSYSATGTASHTMTFAGAYTLSCDASFSGSTENGSTAASTKFTPGYSDCSFFGFPVEITIHGPFELDITTGSSGSYGLGITLPPGSSITIHVPIVGCTVTLTDSQSFVNGSGGNVITGSEVGADFEVNWSLVGIDYTASGCPFSSGSDGTYDTNGDVTFAGVSVDD